MKMRPDITHYKSKVTGKLYEYGGHIDCPAGTYVNHGYGEDKLWKGRKDLPHDEYPYELIREEDIFNDMFYFRVLYWDTDIQWTPTLIEDGDDEIGDFLHNMIVLGWIDDDGFEELEFRKLRFKKLLEVDPHNFECKLKLTVINFVMNDMAGFCNNYKINLFEYPVLKDYLIDLLVSVVINKISYSEATAKVLPHIINKCDRTVHEIIEDLGLGETDDDELSTTIDEIFTKFPDKLEAYHNGNKNLFGMFMGEIMRTGKGFNPKVVNETLTKKLENI